MQNKIKQTVKKQMPNVERVLKWVIRSSFRLMMLVVLAWTVMHFVDAVDIIKQAVAGIVVFATAYFAYIWK